MDLFLTRGVERGGFFARMDSNGIPLELVLKRPEPLVVLDMMH